MKVCSKCKVEKDESEFYRNKYNKDGLHSLCKECKNICNARYISENPEKVKSSHIKWRSKNPEKVKSFYAKYYAKHAEKRKEYSLKWYFENNEKAKASRSRYYAENSEKERDRIAKWRSEHPEEVKLYSNRYYKKLPDAYVKRCISKGEIPHELIPQPLVDFHREVIRAKRFLKELQK